MPFGAAVPAFYTQLSPGGSLRARVEAVPGVAIGGEPTAAAVTTADTTRVWTSAFGVSSRVGADINGPAIKANGGGVTIGADRFFTPTFLAGVAVSYSNIEAKSIGVQTDTDTISGAIYTFWAPFPGWEYESIYGIEASDIETRRILALGPTHGETESLGFSSASNLGYRFRFPTEVGESFVKPFVGYTQTTVDRDGYTEFGDFGPGFIFPSKTFKRSTVNLGAATGIDLAAGNGWVIRPELRVAWSHYLTTPNPRVPVFFDDVGFVLRDPNPGRDGAIVAFEVTGITTGFQVFAGYAGEFRENATAHQGRVGLRLTW